MDQHARGLFFAAIAALLILLVSLLAAFILTMSSAVRYFDRAAAAQTQLAAVARIEAIAAVGFPRPQLDDALASYRASIDRETLLLPPTSTERRAQTREAADARRLAQLATASGNSDRLARLVAHIGQRERAEVARVNDDIRRLRARATVLAILLAMGSVCAVLLGAAALLRANRDLSSKIAARTADLIAVDQSRRLFFAKTSHELRTPVTVLRGEAEVTLSDPNASTAELRASLTHVAANAAYLGRRIEELLALAKADDGKLTLSLQPLDLRDVLRTTANDARGYARSAEVAITTCLPDQSVQVRADARWLGQAIVAILDNGIKFSPQHGSLELTLTVTENQAHISITDQGPGVMAEALPRIFDAYYQADDGHMRGGTGLGLALARWVVEQHGGMIMAENQARGGCRIAITLAVMETPR